jgi:ribosome-binding protein aMBF1 (putative translation factor)
VTKKKTMWTGDAAPSAAKDPLRSRRETRADGLSDEENVTRLSRTRHHRETFEFRGVVVALGRALLALRRDRGWTVEEAAGHFGVEPAFVRRIEAGRTNPSLAVIVSIAKAFGVSLEDLLRDAERDEGVER